MNMMEWCKNKHNIKEWNTAYFQIFSGLYSLQKYTNIYLEDIKFENILVKKVKKDYIHYIIDNNNYIISNCEYLFVLSDFGFTEFLNINYNIEHMFNTTNNYIIKQDLMNYNEEIIEIFKDEYKDEYTKMYDNIKQKIIK